MTLPKSIVVFGDRICFVIGVELKLMLLNVSSFSSQVLWAGSELTMVLSKENSTVDSGSSCHHSFQLPFEVPWSQVQRKSLSLLSRSAGGLFFHPGF